MPDNNQRSGGSLRHALLQTYFTLHALAHAARGPCTEQLELNIPSDLVHLLVGFTHTHTLHIGLIRLRSLHVAGCLLPSFP